jgi:TPR repeat protein
LGKRGVSKDPTRATHFEERACDLGIWEECRWLAVALANGRGIQKDERRAASLFIHACRHDDLDACESGAHFIQEARKVLGNHDDDAFDLAMRSAQRNVVLDVITAGVDHCTDAALERPREARDTALVGCARLLDEVTPKLRAMPVEPPVPDDPPDLERVPIDRDLTRTCENMVDAAVKIDPWYVIFALPKTCTALGVKLPPAPPQGH